MATHAYEVSLHTVTSLGRNSGGGIGYKLMTVTLLAEKQDHLRGPVGPKAYRAPQFHAEEHVACGTVAICERGVAESRDLDADLLSHVTWTRTCQFT